MFDNFFFIKKVFTSRTFMMIKINMKFKIYVMILAKMVHAFLLLKSASLVVNLIQIYQSTKLTIFNKDREL